MLQVLTPDVFHMSAMRHGNGLGIARALSHRLGPIAQSRVIGKVILSL